MASKEVSDRVVIFLVFIAVLVSFLGTYLVYTNAANVPNLPLERTIIINKEPDVPIQYGKVAIYINEVKKEELSEGNEDK